MTRSEQLSVLDLTDTHLGPKDLEDLAGLIKPNRLLKSLKIGDKNMTDECTKKMIETTFAMFGEWGLSEAGQRPGEEGVRIANV